MLMLTWYTMELWLFFCLAASKPTDEYPYWRANLQQLWKIMTDYGRLWKISDVSAHQPMFGMWIKCIDEHQHQRLPCQWCSQGWSLWAWSMTIVWRSPWESWEVATRGQGPVAQSTKTWFNFQTDSTASIGGYFLPHFCQVRQVWRDRFPLVFKLSAGDSYLHAWEPPWDGSCRLGSSHTTQLWWEAGSSWP